jgi:hypothetical protein
VATSQPSSISVGGVNKAFTADGWRVAEAVPHRTGPPIRESYSAHRP